MNKFKVNEMFPAIQGEGKTIGNPVVFIRFYGCNLHCPWCDSLYAIEGKEYTEMTVDDILLEVYKYPQIKKVVLTGGEPMVQLKNDLGRELLTELEREHEIEIETNGILLTEKMIENKYQFNVSPKFYSGNNYDWRKNYFPKRLKEVFNTTDSYMSSVKLQFKFVLEHGEKRQECIDNINEFIKYFNIDKKYVYIMSEGQTFDEQKSRMKEDLEFCLQNGFNYTPRMHILVYNDKRGV
ncbi:7-carboxy-7-deazaguanine synthase QueE [Candidatus Woesearchaeota archaeon]|nr:7-carboxy-7-deazaguanine synthase QueE [Candidatus Woesearchaeota archaeon]